MAFRGSHKQHDPATADSKSVKSIARTLFRWQNIQPSPSQSSAPISIVCISDTHTTRPTLPDGDLLLHAGDLSQTGSFQEIQDQLDWLHAQPHKYMIVIAGNHDLLLDPAFVDQFPQRILERPGFARADLRWHDVTYLQDEAVTLEFAGGRSLTVYGSPWTSQFGTWAFQYPPIRDVWSSKIPEHTDILLTHGPPAGHLDDGGKGSCYLLKDLQRVRPKLVVFGHIHAGHGREDVVFDRAQGMYDDIVWDRNGLLSLFFLAVLILWGVIRRMWPVGGRQGGRMTTLINASVVGGPGNSIERPAQVVQI